jgi:hypothetical protein
MAGMTDAISEGLGRYSIGEKLLRVHFQETAFGVSSREDRRV